MKFIVYTFSKKKINLRSFFFVVFINWSEIKCEYLLLKNVEKAAIELGGDILSEFFVFGTAVALLLIEYIRQASNTVKKETALVEKVESLEKEQSELLIKLEKTNQRMTEMNEFLTDQRTKMEDLNAKYIKLDARRNLKFATQSVQTGDSVIVGKVMYARNSTIDPAADVTNSILYQVASMAVDQLKNIAQVPILRIEKDPEPIPVVVPLPVPASKTNISNTKTKQVSKQATSSKLNEKQSLANLKK